MFRHWIANSIAVPNCNLEVVIHLQTFLFVVWSVLLNVSYIDNLKTISSITIYVIVILINGTNNRTL